MKLTHFEIREVATTHYACDGPLHEGKKEITFIHCELSHGYPSEYDESTQHFCSMKCLTDWVINPPNPKDVRDYLD